MKTIACTVIICITLLIHKAMDMGIIGSSDVSVIEYNELVDKVNDMDAQISRLEKMTEVMRNLLERMDAPAVYEQLATTEE